MPTAAQREEQETLTRHAARTLADCALLQRLAQKHRLTKALIQHVLRYHAVGSKTTQVWNHLLSEGYLRKLSIKPRTFFLLSPEGSQLANSVSATLAIPQAKTILEQNGLKCDMNTYRALAGKTIDPLTASSADIQTAREMALHQKRNQRKIAIANHLLMERIFGAPLPSKLSSWAFIKGYNGRQKISSTRAESKRLGYVDKSRFGDIATYRWFVTEQGKNWLPDDIEPNITEQEAESKIRTSGFKPISSSERNSETNQLVSSSGYTKDQIAQALTDFKFMEDFLGCAVPARLTALTFERAFPAYKPDSPHAARIKNRYQAIRCEGSGNIAAWFTTPTGKHLIERGNKTPTLNDESVLDLIEEAGFVFHAGNLVKAFKQSYKQISNATQRERLRAFRADHQFCEKILKGPLPEAVTKTLLTHHDAPDQHHRSLLASECQRRYLTCSEAQGHGRVYQISKFGREDLEIHEISPSLTKPIANALIARAGISLKVWTHPAILEETPPSPLEKVETELAEIEKEISQLVMKKRALLRQKEQLTAQGN